jgi:meiotically up-regulated gene 157 (Mug157) protein
MDDANIPSLLSLPLLGFVDASDAVYQNTRRLVLSRANPYYFEGPLMAGIGGPHVPLNYAWPMSQIVRVTPPLPFLVLYLTFTIIDLDFK